MSKYKFVDEDKTREYFEVTTEAMQYHWGEGVRYLGSAPNQMVGLDGKLWSAEVLRNKKWFYVGSFKTGREARKAVIEAYAEAKDGVDAERQKAD